MEIRLMKRFEERRERNVTEVGRKSNFMSKKLHLFAFMINEPSDVILFPFHCSLQNYFTCRETFSKN